MALLANPAKQDGVVWKKYGNWAKINLVMPTGTLYHNVYRFGASFAQVAR
jgi:hypothetical protein